MKFLLSFFKLVALPFTYLSKLDQIPARHIFYVIRNSLTIFQQFAWLLATFLVGSVYAIKINSSIDFSIDVQSMQTIAQYVDNQIRISSGISSNTVNSLFFISLASKLKLNWKKYLKLLLIIIYLIIPISYFCFGIELNDNIIYRSYLYILNLPLNLPSYFFIYFIIIWQVLALIFFMLDYIKHKYFYEKKIFNICKFLPGFIKNYISLVNENSDKPELKEAILEIKRKAIKWTIISLVIVDLVLYLLIN